MNYIARDSIKETYLESVEEQLRLCSPLSTKEAFECLLNKGLDEENAKLQIAYQLECMLYNMLEDEKPFDETIWDFNMRSLCEHPLLPGENMITSYQLQKVPSQIRKTYGCFYEEEIENYEDCLFAIEKNLLIFSNMYHLSAKQLKEILCICLNEMDGFLKQSTYDYEKATTIDIVCMAKDFEKNFNPFVNEELMKELLKEYSEFDPNNKDTQIDCLKIAMLCMDYVSREIDSITKKLGNVGYLNYLESCLYGDQINLF